MALSLRNAVCSFRVRLFSTGLCCANNSKRQQFTMLNKLLDRSSKKVQKALTNSNSFSQPVVAREGKYYPMQESRRQIILNNLLLENLCDLLSTGEIGKSLSGYGFEILKVQTTKNYSVVKVFWCCTSNEDQLQQILNENSSKIRSDLIKQHILGTVPQIQFFCDKSQSAKNRIFHLLDKVSEELNIESDIVPNNWREIPVIKSDVNTKSNINHEIKDIKTNDLGAMTHDIFGLDHGALMKKVTEKCGKRKQENELFRTNKGSVSKMVSIHSDANKQFAKFLQERKFKRNKKLQVPDYHLDETNCEVKQDINVEIDDEDFYEEEENINNDYK